MHPDLCNLGPFPLHTYGLLAAIGFALGILVVLYYAKREGLNSEMIMDLALYVIIAAIVGARLFYVIGEWETFRGNWKEIIMVQNGGLVFLGGLIVAALVVVYYARVKNILILKLLDAITPSVALGEGIGRLGCFFNGCCFGLPTKLPWGLSFPPGSLAYQYFGGEHIHPTQLYSASGLFLVFLALIWLYRRKEYDGQIFYWGIVFYAIYRFSVEFFRFSPIHWAGLTPSQWIVLIAAALALFGIFTKRGH